MPSRIDPDILSGRQPVSRSGLRRTLGTVRDELEHQGFFRAVATGAVERRGTEKIADWLAAADFGAVGDGIVDDTAALQAALDALAQRGGTLLLAAGARYRISRGLTLLDARGFRIEGQGAAVRMTDGAPVDVPFWLLHLERCTAFAIADLELDGNRSTRTIGPEPWANNLQLHACRRFRLTGVHSHDAVVDGFMLYHGDRADPSTFCREGLIEACSATGCARQGLTILNAFDITVHASTFAGSRGVPPESGIDVESHTDSAVPSNARIVISACRIADHVGGGVLLTEHGGARSMTVTDCSFEACGRFGVFIGAGDCIVRDCRFSRFDHAVEHGVINVRNRAGGMPPLITGNSFSELAMGNPDQAAIYVRPEAGLGTLIVGNRLEAVDATGITATAPGTIIRGNVLRGNRQDGMRIGGQCLVEGNLISDMADVGPAILVYGGGAVIRANQLVNCTNGGLGAIRVIQEPGEPSGPSIVADNLLRLDPPVDGAVAVRFTVPGIERDNDVFGYG